MVFLDLPALNLGLLKVRGFCRFCDLTNLNLEKMDFNGADLYYANLAHADLRRVNLTGTDLSDVNFFNSTMGISTNPFNHSWIMFLPSFHKKTSS